MSEEIKEETSLAEQTEQEETQESTSDIKAQIDEKLDIVPNENVYNQELRKDLKANVKALQSLLNLGLINEQQGQNLLNHIIRTALDENVQQKPIEEASKTFDKVGALREFEKENPDFFCSDGRSEVLNYLKSDEIQFDKDELSKIAKIVEQVEKSAIEEYIKKAAHEENLEKSNTEAKQRLKANAQKSKSDGKNNVPFTREQIGKMSGAEFLENEKKIMDQLKKGLIK
ncbi:hypothetical protein IKE67_09250 [bacterium]|nr:hypothetical protein [bacterium]